MAKDTIRPWLVGVVDTLIGAEYLRRSEIPHKNRLAVILIDSAFETACRAYLRNVAKVRLQDSHRGRANLVKAVKAKLKEVDDAVWENIEFYYTEIRNDFYHESAGKTITDVAVRDYRDTIEFVIDAAFDVHVGAMVNPEVDVLIASSGPSGETSQTPKPIRITDLDSPVDKVIVAVGHLSPSKVDAVNDFLKREGDSLRLRSDEFTNMVARNTGSKKFFYHSKETKTWELSGLGQFKLTQLAGSSEHGQ